MFIAGKNDLFGAELAQNLRVFAGSIAT